MGHGLVGKRSKKYWLQRAIKLSARLFCATYGDEKSKTIGVIVPDITNPFFAQLIRGIESVLYKENFILMLCNAEQDVTREHEYLTELIRRSVDGFVIASSEISNQTINETLRAKRFRLLYLTKKQKALATLF